MQAHTSPKTLTVGVMLHKNYYVNLHRLIMTLNNFESQSKSLLDLNVRVQAFSVSKDVIQKYKLLTKQTKTKSLCKELSRNQEEPRQD